MPLVIVIWAIGLLSAMAVSFAWSSTVSQRLATNSLDLAKIDALAEAGINRAALSLFDPRPDLRWRKDGVAQFFDFDGVQMKISVQDELGRIDLNHADVRLLTGLLRSADLDPQSAESLAAKIVDWRESLPFKHLNGASATDYRLAGFNYRPRGGPFQSVDEVLLVMSMTPELFRKIEPALTVYSGRALFDPLVATRQALLALPDMTPEKAAAIIDNRRDQNTSGLTEAGQLQGRAFTIRVEMMQANRSVGREAVVRLTGKPPQPYWTLNWKAK